MPEFGDQQPTNEDRGYAGSRFSEVVGPATATRVDGKKVR